MEDKVRNMAKDIHMALAPRKKVVNRHSPGERTPWSCTACLDHHYTTAPGPPPALQRIMGNQILLRMHQGRAASPPAESIVVQPGFLEKDFGHLAGQNRPPSVLRQKRPAPGIIQRTTDQAADLTVLRAALSRELNRVRAMTPAGPGRDALESLRARIPRMEADELRSELAGISSRAQSSQSALATTGTRVAPSPTPPSADLVTEADLHLEQARRYNLHRLIRHLDNLSTSTSPTGRNIGRMFREMNTGPANVEWHINIEARGITAAVTYRGTRGTPPAADIRIIIGFRGYLFLQNPDPHLILPTLYHELYHAYEHFRESDRGQALPARPNFSRAEMARLIEQLESGSDPQLAGDAARHGASALGHAFYVESEMMAELMAHSALQEPSIAPGGPGSPRTTHLVARSEEEVRYRLRELRMMYGLAAARRIAEALLHRADNEPWLHEATRRRFLELVDMVVPALRPPSPSAAAGETE